MKLEIIALDHTRPVTRRAIVEFDGGGRPVDCLDEIVAGFENLDGESVRHGFVPQCRGRLEWTAADVEIVSAHQVAGSFLSVTYRPRSGGPTTVAIIGKAQEIAPGPAGDAGAPPPGT
jgi:hypothetical protein